MDTNELIHPELAKLLTFGCIELQEDYQGANARLYDSIQGGTRDLDFYIRIIGSKPVTVLELGSGTGRIAIPLAKKGHTIYALDSSPDMHQILRKKIPQSIRDRIIHVEQNMKNFRIDMSFDFIILGLNTIFSLIEEKDRNDCFKAVRKHLKSNGRFIIDFATPSVKLITNTDGKYTLSVYNENGGRGSLVITYNRYDLKRQLSILNFLTLEITDNRISKGYLTPAAEYYPSPMELKLLLEKSWMSVKEIFGDYDGRPFSDKGEGRDVIIIAQPMKHE